MRLIPILLACREENLKILTDFTGGNFTELQDLYTNFFIVADEIRRREFQSKVSLEALKPSIKGLDFGVMTDVAELHSRTMKFVTVESRLRL